MKYTAISPTDEKFEVDITEEGTKVCRQTSPAVCYKPDDPEGEGIKVVLERLFHEGWTINAE